MNGEDTDLGGSLDFSTLNSETAVLLDSDIYCANTVYCTGKRNCSQKRKKGLCYGASGCGDTCRCIKQKRCKGSGKVSGSSSSSSSSSSDDRTTVKVINSWKFTLTIQKSSKITVWLIVKSWFLRAQLQNDLRNRICRYRKGLSAKDIDVVVVSKDCTSKKLVFTVTVSVTKSNYKYVKF